MAIHISYWLWRTLKYLSPILEGWTAKEVNYLRYFKIRSLLTYIQTNVRYTHKNAKLYINLNLLILE